MNNDAKKVLTRLRDSLAAMAEKAYSDRDSAEASSARAYAAGESHAYSIAEAEVRKAEKNISAQA